MNARPKIPSESIASVDRGATAAVKMDSPSDAPLERSVRSRLRANRQEKKTHDAHLLRIIDQCRLAHARRNCLLAATGHDLRQPLQMLSFALERLRLAPASQGDTDWLAIASHQIDRLTAGLTRLTQASRDAFTDEIAFETFSIASVLQTLVSSWQFHAAANGNILFYHEADWLVESNVELLTTILSNILGNAARYTYDSEIHVRSRSFEKVVLVEIFDTGSGIDDDAIKSLGQPNSRAIGSGERLGRGLDIVGCAARLLDHRILMTSVPGCGTHFSIELPKGLPACAPRA
jgi:two-component system, sensor histidine kinase